MEKIVTGFSKKNIRILVIDDESFILNITVRILDKLGYDNVDTAKDGNVALGKLISKEIPDYNLIICDLNMPEMDGVEFMRHAHEAEYAGGIILYSGEDQRVLETALELAKDHKLNVLGALSKPLKPDSLKELLKDFDPFQTAEKRNFFPQEPITEEELKAGITGRDRDALMLVYQPKVHIQSGEIEAVETLARWQHADRGVLGPGAFIPLAEQTGTIDDLTYQIYRKAVHQVLEWVVSGHIIKNSVNFSINSFAKSSFADFIVNTTKDIGVDPNLIILEVTETQVMDDAIDCIEILMRLRIKRFGLSIDDFGTGNSSMAQLKRIPFTELKIDRAFVNGATTNAGANAILRSSIDLAKRLNMKIVAEGVETREEWDLVEELGCDYVQGFYCAKPMPNDEFMQFFEEWDGPH